MAQRSFLSWAPIERLRNPPPVVGVLRFAGVIGQVGALRRGLTYAGVTDAIESAFRLRRLKAVALVVNSPGGSPVQAALIAKRIRRLAADKGVPVFAFAEDVAASGGYWLAAAGDEIYADESSIVGSIGVVSGGFGFAGLIKRYGIERRLYTAGERKAILDPFLAEKPEDVAHLKTVQSDIHDAFKALVRERRAGRLKASDEEVFSGAFWTGRRALEMGLIDGLGDLHGVMRQRYGENVKLRLITEPRSWVRRRLGWSGGGGEWARPDAWVAGLVQAVEERLWWGRFGL